MDRLRQVLMCHADLTPSPLYRWDGFNLAFGRAGEHNLQEVGTYPGMDGREEAAG